MKLIKAEINPICYVLAITDDNDNVLTTSIFSTERDLESVKTFVDGLLVQPHFSDEPKKLSTFETSGALLEIALVFL